MTESFRSLALVLPSFDLAGSECVGAMLAVALSERGWDVHVCATHAADGPLRRQLEARGIPCIGFDIERHGQFERRLRIYRELASMRPTVVHVQHFAMLALCYLPARLAGVRRIVVTEHSDHRLRNDPRLRRRAVRLARSVDGITVIHPGLRDYLVRELGMPADRVRLIANGVDTHRFRPKNSDQTVSVASGRSEMVIGCVARLHPVKDHWTLLEAFASLPAGTARLLIVGEGPERSRLEQRVSEFNLEAQVEFLGERSDIESVMARFDCFVLSSRSEGLPMVLLEAMACGVPCVATAVGGVPSLLDESAGILVPPGDPAALAEALEILRRDPQLRQRLGRQARELATSRYGMDRIVDAYAAVLDPPARGEDSGEAAAR